MFHFDFWLWSPHCRLLFVKYMTTQCFGQFSFQNRDRPFVLANNRIILVCELDPSPSLPPLLPLSPLPKARRFPLPDGPGQVKLPVGQVDFNRFFFLTSYTLGYKITAVGTWGWIKSGARKKVKISLREVVSNKRLSRKKFWYLLQNYFILLEDMENFIKSGGIC